jgi:hypothetical protein
VNPADPKSLRLEATRVRLLDKDGLTPFDLLSFETLFHLESWLRGMHTPLQEWGQLRREIVRALRDKAAALERLAAQKHPSDPEGTEYGYTRMVEDVVA